ncbi:MAG: molybdenum cofactor biosynthesis protein MoaE [Thermodesulfobacteriota bacterium]
MDLATDIAAALAEIQEHPRLNQAGMVLVHYGLVRGFDLSGRPVQSLTVNHDAEKIEALRREFLARPGIVEILVRTNSGVLRAGEMIMLVAVAGETRDKVFPVMMELIDRMKGEASVKSEETA